MHSCGKKDVLSIPAEGAFKLVEDAVVLVQVAQFPSQMIVHVDRLHRLRLHVDVPDPQREVVAREDVATVLGELDVGNGGDDLGEEGFVRWILLFLVD